MKYLEKSFSVSMAGNREHDEKWNKIFCKDGTKIEYYTETFEHTPIHYIGESVFKSYDEDKDANLLYKKSLSGDLKNGEGTIVNFTMTI